MSPLALEGLFAASAVGAGLLAWTLILWLRPRLVRFASRGPTIRSTHKQPTPQGAGIAVIVALPSRRPSGEPRLRGLDRPFLGLLAGLAVAIGHRLRRRRPWQGWRAETRLAGTGLGLALVTLPDTSGCSAGIAAILAGARRDDGLARDHRQHRQLSSTGSTRSPPPIRPRPWPLPAGRSLRVTSTAAPAFRGRPVRCGHRLLAVEPPSPRIFLGDSGSLPLGLALGWLALMLASVRAPRPECSSSPTR